MNRPQEASRATGLETYEDDLKSPQSRRKRAVVNENAENRSGLRSLPRTSRATVQRRKQLRIWTGGKEKKYEAGEGDKVGPQGMGRTHNCRGVKNQPDL